MHTYVFAGGGSGGHLFPAIAIAHELRRRESGCHIVFIGGRRQVEGDILGREPFERCTLTVSPSSDVARNPVRFGWRHWRAMRMAAGWLRNWRPQAVIGCGGYVSVPVALAARKAGLPLALLEQNVVPGRATSWLARSAAVVCTSFDATARYLPRGTHALTTGNPVRPDIAGLAAQTSDPPDTPPTLLILGGSQGATSVNSMLLQFVERHRAALAGWRIVHQTGAADEPRVRQRYAELSIEASVSGFFIDMAAAYAGAHLIVSRAGATTLAELACAGRPAILIPYPRAVRDHQRHNAEFCGTHGAARVVEDGAGDDLATALLPLLSEPELRRAMATQMRRLARPTALQCATDAVLDAARNAKAAGGTDVLRPQEESKSTGSSPAR